MTFNSFNSPSNGKAVKKKGSKVPRPEQLGKLDDPEAECTMLSMLINKPRLRHYFEMLDEEDFLDPAFKKIFITLKKHHEAGIDFNTMYLYHKSFGLNQSEVNHICSYE